MGSVSFSGARGQARRASRPAREDAPDLVKAHPASPAAHLRSQTVLGKALRSAWHALSLAGACNPALKGGSTLVRPSRRPPAPGRCWCGQCASVGTSRLQQLPTPAGAVRAGPDLNGGHAAHEGLRIVTRLRVRRWHDEQQPRSGQPVRLGSGCQHPVVANPLEPRRQHVLQEAADELPAVHGQRALATAGPASGVLA